MGKFAYFFRKLKLIVSNYVPSILRTSAPQDHDYLEDVNIVLDALYERCCNEYIEYLKQYEILSQEKLLNGVLLEKHIELRNEVLDSLSGLVCKQIKYLQYRKQLCEKLLDFYDMDSLTQEEIRSVLGFTTLIINKTMPSCLNLIGKMKGTEFSPPPSQFDLLGFWDSVTREINKLQDHFTSVYSQVYRHFPE